MAVLITGASRGIGRASALELAGERDVAINHRDSADEADAVVEEARESGARRSPFGRTSAIPRRSRQ